jgi:signal transduction histidine kinase
MHGGPHHLRGRPMSAAVSDGVQLDQARVLGGRPSALAWTLWVVTAATTSAGLVLIATEATPWRQFLAAGHPDSAVVGVAGGFFGALIVRYRPRNPVGWLLVANAAGHGLRTFAAAYASFALVHRHGSLPGGALASWLAMPALITAGPLLAFAFLRFPDGRLLSRRWRAVEASLAAVVVLALAAVAVVSWPLRGQALLDGAPFPPTSRGHALTVVSNAGQSLVAVGLILGAVALAYRYRRSAGLQRQQLKWMAFGAIPTVGLLIAGRLVAGVAGGIVVMASPLPVLVTIVVAIRRYRLYDIDRIISRTLAYAGVTGVLAAAFFAVSTLVAAMFGLAGSGSPGATAAAAVAVTALFQPVRHRLQDLSDRRFQRRSYEAGRIVSAYLESLRRQEPGAGALGAMVRKALADPSATVWFWLGGHGYVAEGGTAIDLADAADRDMHRVDRAGEHLGMVLVDRHMPDQAPGSPAAEIIAAATPAFDHGRLRAQAMVQLAEVRASRARIVAAADQARRRVEQDLHDGAQQRIIALGLSLAALSTRAKRARQPEMAAALTAVKDEAEAALHDLRELARGIHPAVLTEQGIGAAVESLAERCPVPVRVAVEAGDRLTPELEATAYYVVAESLANVAKYAQASRAVIRVRAAGGRLRVEVEDDGRGGASPRTRSGLAGLRDRVEAVGGQLTVASPAGAGTRVVAELPL